MEYCYENGRIRVKNLNSFSLMQTLECGQCFRAESVNENCYYTIAHNKKIYIEKKGEDFFFYPSTLLEFESMWLDYFDLNRDYDGIKEILSANDFVMRDAVEYGSGIRILKQEFFECLISFIISQNNRIPMIRQVIKNLSEAFGVKLDEHTYSFPTLSVLSSATPAELRLLKTGFRDKYIIDACEKIREGIIKPETFKNLDTVEIRQELMKIKGVGVKVADCTILFSVGRYDSFPTDVWVKRVMEHFYFNNEQTSIEDIHGFAKRSFGDYQGFAQEYLFYYARQFKIGK